MFGLFRKSFVKKGVQKVSDQVKEDGSVYRHHYIEGDFDPAGPVYLIVEAHMRCSIYNVLWKRIGHGNIRLWNPKNNKTLILKANIDFPDEPAKSMYNPNLSYTECSQGEDPYQKQHSSKEYHYANPELVDEMICKLDLLRNLEEYNEIH